LIVVGYQNFVTYPALQGALAEPGRRDSCYRPGQIGEAWGVARPTVVVAGKPFLLPLDISRVRRFMLIELSFRRRGKSRVVA